MIRNTQQKIKTLFEQGARSVHVSTNQLEKKKEDKQSNKENPSASLKGGNDMGSSSNSKESFEKDEKVLCFDIKLQKNVEAVIVNRVTYSQYAVRIGKNPRAILRNAFFLTKQNKDIQ